MPRSHFHPPSVQLEDLPHEDGLQPPGLRGKIISWSWYSSGSIAGTAFGQKSTAAALLQSLWPAVSGSGRRKKEAIAQAQMMPKAPPSQTVLMHSSNILFLVFAALAQHAAHMCILPQCTTRCSAPVEAAKLPAFIPKES